MKTKLTELSQSLDGVFKAQFEIPKTEIEDVKKLRGCEVSLEVKKWRNKRSLDANAYAWVLISQIADKLNETAKEQITKDAVYVDMLKHYGVSLVVSVKSEEDIKKIEKAFKYYEPFGTGIVGEKHFTHYKIYIGSSGYDTKEMTIFIKGIVQECEQLGIPTMTESELMKLEGVKMTKDLFGNEIIEDVILRDKFIEPPFSVLDTKSGSWQNRKMIWKEKGIKSEIGRDKELCMAQSLNKYDPRESYTGTSIFDPVICEIMYRWFCIKEGHILDPFAGGSVRGIVANYLGYKYTGIELRQEQVDSNREQALDILPIDNQPNYYIGDSEKELDGFNKQFDFIFSCPPYMDLEQYSDNKCDLSNMSDDEFIAKYEKIINKSCKLLKNDCFACFVVGDVRDKKTGFYKDFITITKNAFYKSGLRLYNEAIMLENGLNTAAMRADKLFTSSQKLVKVHQNVLIFKKELK